MSMGRLNVSPGSIPALVKPTLDTPFHVDYEWWKRQGMQIDVEMKAHLCPEHQAVYADAMSTDLVDWVDSKTGEVTRVNGLQHLLQVHCSKQTDYISQGLSLVNAVFRVFLANSNAPQNCRQLSEIIGHPPEKILRTLSGRRVYKGIRPVRD